MLVGWILFFQLQWWRWMLLLCCWTRVNRCQRCKRTAWLYQTKLRWLAYMLIVVFHRNKAHFCLLLLTLDIQHMVVMCMWMVGGGYIHGRHALKYSRIMICIDSYLLVFHCYASDTRHSVIQNEPYDEHVMCTNDMCSIIDPSSMCEVFGIVLGKNVGFGNSMLI